MTQTPRSPRQAILNSSLLFPLFHSVDDLVNHTGVTECRCITQAILLTTQDLSQNASHDLAGSSLWQIIHNEDSLGCGERTNRLPHLQNEILPCAFAWVRTIFESNEGIDSLACKLIIDTDDGSLCDAAMLDESRFDLGG